MSDTKQQMLDTVLTRAGTFMTDRKLLERAARAAGFKWIVIDGRFSVKPDGESRRTWNPLRDDGDALHLAVKLCIEVSPANSFFCIATLPDPSGDGKGKSIVERIHDSSEALAATRRAIVRAAAAMADNQGGV